MAHEIENFYGVYLLECKNPKYKGHTYIGFTVNPNRRIQQHNRGREAGGAKRTSGRGPWDMTLIIHGFPNQISALKFEWAWQNPYQSRKLRSRDGKNKKKSETAYDHKIRIMCMMLQSGPWNRLPLTIRWLKQEYERNFLPELQPPMHMPIAHGPVRIVNKAKKKKPGESEEDTGVEEDHLSNLGVTRCAKCSKKIQDKKDMLQCYHPGCTMMSHIVCLAQHFLKGTQELLPLDGICPYCKCALLWGDLMRHRLGCKDMLEQAEEEEIDGDHWADELV